MSIFLAFKVLQQYWDILSLKTIADLQLLGNMRLVKCHDVGVDLDFFAFSNGDSFNACHSLFPRGVDISAVANANSLLLITLLEVFHLLSGNALHLVLWKFFIFRMLSVHLWLSISTNEFLFLVFLMLFLGSFCCNNFFNEERGELS